MYIVIVVMVIILIGSIWAVPQEKNCRGYVIVSGKSG